MNRLFTELHKKLEDPLPFVNADVASIHIKFVNSKLFKMVGGVADVSVVGGLDQEVCRVPGLHLETVAGVVMVAPDCLPGTLVALVIPAQHSVVTEHSRQRYTSIVNMNSSQRTISSCSTLHLVSQSIRHDLLQTHISAAKIIFENRCQSPVSDGCNNMTESVTRTT